MYIKKGQYKKIKVPPEILLEEYNSGLNLRQIAEKHNVSHQAISLRLIKLNYKRRIRPITYIDFNCKHCKKKTTRKSSQNDKYFFCSLKCCNKSKELPIKEKMRRRALFANRYYHEVLKRNPTLN